MIGKRTTWLAVLTAAAGLTLAQATWAQAPARAARADEGEDIGLAAGDRPLARCLRETFQRLRDLRTELNLSPEQKQQIGAILKAHRTQIVTVIRDVHQKRRALMDAVRVEQPDERAIRRAARELSDVVADAAVLRAQVRQEVRKVLTPEQRGRADEAIEGIERMWDEAIAELGKD